MRDERDRIRIFLTCAGMVLLGYIFNKEGERGYSAFLIFMAFITLLYILMIIGQTDWQRRRKTISVFLFSLAETLWLGWVGIPLNRRFILCFMGAVCAAWFLLNLVYIYLYQRPVIARWNTACAAWKSGGSAESYLKEIEQCEAALKRDTGFMLMYNGMPLNNFITVQKIRLLKEMGRGQECLTLLKSVRPKIKNPQVQKALSEEEAEITKTGAKRHG